MHIFRIVYQVLLNVMKNNKGVPFVVIINKNYTFKRVVNIDMGYKNARLVNPLPDLWVRYLNNESCFDISFEHKSESNNGNNTPEISPSPSNVSQQNSQLSSELSSNSSQPINVIASGTSSTCVQFRDVLSIQDITLCDDNKLVTCKTTCITQDTTKIPFKIIKHNQMINKDHLVNYDTEIALYLMKYKHLYIQSTHKVCIINSEESILNTSQTIMDGTGNVIKICRPKINNYVRNC